MSKILKFELSKNNDSRNYYFSTDNYDYVVSVYYNCSDTKFPWFGFKAKKPDEFNIFFDADIITNDNIYIIKNTILEILKYDSNNNYNINGYTFSTRNNKKGKQRMLFYNRIIKETNYIIELSTYNPNARKLYLK